MCTAAFILDSQRAKACSSRVWLESVNRGKHGGRQTCFEMRLERQPGLQLRGIAKCLLGKDGERERETKGEKWEEEIKERRGVKWMEGAGRVMTGAVCKWQKRERRQVCQSTSNQRR